MFTPFMKQANSVVEDEQRRFYHAIIGSTECNKRAAFI